jgi:hypothetical protein
MKYVTRRAVPSQVNRNSRRPPPSGRACGIRNAGPDWASRSNARSASALSLLLSVAYQFSTSRGDLYGPAVAHRLIIAPTLYRVHAIAGSRPAVPVTHCNHRYGISQRQAVERVVDRVPVASWALWAF